jgi:hypothetical protein
MTTRRHPALVTTAVVLVTVCAACARADGDAPEPAGSAGGSSAQAARPSVVELTADTLSAYERGLRKEIEAVRAAQQAASAATTPEQRGHAIQGSFEHATIPQGAEAAGLPLAQYRGLRETVNGVFRTLDFQGKIDGPLSIDLTRVDAATKERVSRDPFADLSAGSAAALRSRMDRLVPVWAEYVRLTAVAG